jgi:hypothetical protein
MNSVNVVKNFFPRAINYNDLFILYNENKEKLFMTSADKVGQHKPSAEGFKQLEDNIRQLHNISNTHDEIDTYLNFIDFVKNNIRYVPFNEYMSKIVLISKEIIEQIKNYDIVFFVCAGPVTSSNLWVMLLFFGELLKLNVEQYKDKIFLLKEKYLKEDPPICSFNISFAEKNNDKQILCIHFDDMAYTGDQLYSDIPSELMDDVPNLKYYIAISYLTNAAKNQLNKKNVSFYENTEIIQNIQDIINEYYKDQPDIKKKMILLCSSPLLDNSMNLIRGKNVFKCLGRKSIIYFDHKIADAASILYNIIGHGAYPNNISKDTISNLIRNSRSTKKSLSLPVKYSGSVISSCDNNTRDPKKDCYTAFYKKFKYSFKGYEVLKDTTLQEHRDPRFNIVYQINRINDEFTGSNRKIGGSNKKTRKTRKTRKIRRSR